VRVAHVGEESHTMSHYVLYAVRQSAGVHITIGQDSQEKLHVVSIDLGKPDEDAVESFRLLLAQVRDVEKQESEKLS
jgi:hypothetical protein